jgi:GAF domain-containing protein
MSSAAAAGDLGTAEVFAALARSLAELGAMRPTLEQLVSRAVDLVPCDWAAVAAAEHLSRRPARHSAGTDEELMRTVAAIAGSIGTSPGWDAFKRGTVEYSPDLTTEGRYGSYPSEMVARTPIRSVLSFGLQLHDKPLGVLTLYSRGLDAFDEGAQTRGALLAEHATIAIDAATVACRAETLRTALETNRSIGAAVGILVERHKVSPEQAFDLLKVVSQRSNRRLADLADELVRTGRVSPSD